MKRGFTITEMLVVIALIAILTAILLPVFTAVRESARQNACQGNLRDIGIALSAYSQDYDGVNVLSFGRGIVNNYCLFFGWYAHLLFPYTRSTAIYACGSHTPTVPNFDPKPFNPLTREPALQVSYAINANNDDAIRDNCAVVPSIRLSGFAGISTLTLRIPRPEERLALMDAPTEINPTGTPPNGWRIFDPNNDPSPLRIWLLWRPDPLRPPVGERHSGGVNFLFADGHVQWVELNQGLANPRWVAQ